MDSDETFRSDLKKRMKEVDFWKRSHVAIPLSASSKRRH